MDGIESRPMKIQSNSKEIPNSSDSEQVDPAPTCSPFDLLVGQIEAMKHRSEVYRSEAEADDDHAEAEKHMRVYMVLKELHRLGKHFEANGKDHRP